MKRNQILEDKNITEKKTVYRSFNPNVIHEWFRLV